MKKTYKLILVLITLLGLSIIMNMNSVSAASASITGNKTVNVGDKVTVTANVTAGAWNLVLEGANQNKGLVGQTSKTDNENASVSISFTAEKVGTYKFTLTGDITDYYTDANTDVNKSCTITVKEKEEVKQPENNNNNNSNNNSNTEKPSTAKSNNNKLKMLGIKPHDFKNFKSGTTTYYVSVPNDTEEVEVYAEKQVSSQKISGTGKVKLKEGSNTVKVVCTAEDGTTKTYTMYITREKANEEKTNDTNQEEQPASNEEEQQTEEENLTDENETTNEEVLGINKINIIGKTEKGESIKVELNPEFSELIGEYQVSVPLTVNDLDISVEMAEGTASVEASGNKGLVEGNNSVTVIVTVGDKKKVYQINVTKEAQAVTKLSNEVILQLAVISAIATAVMAAIVVIIMAIIRNRKKAKEKYSKVDVEIGDFNKLKVEDENQLENTNEQKNEDEK